MTHGPPGARQHVWTFVVAENDVQMLNYNCPCSNTSLTGSNPTILRINISVTLVAIHQGVMLLPSTSMTHFGMVRDVLLIAAAVSLTLLPGSVSLYSNPPQTTWRLDYVVVSKVILQTKLLVLLLFISNEDLFIILYQPLFLSIVLFCMRLANTNFAAF